MKFKLDQVCDNSIVNFNKYRYVGLPKDVEVNDIEDLKSIFAEYQSFELIINFTEMTITIYNYYLE